MQLADEVDAEGQMARRSATGDGGTIDGLSTGAPAAQVEVRKERSNGKVQVSNRKRLRFPATAEVIQPVV
jgi:hypothetical protein